MDIKALYGELFKAYSDENLNRITGELIQLYQTKNFTAIREIANKVSQFHLINEEKDVRCFSKLIMLYHPDKGNANRIELMKHYREKSIEKLNRYAHILIFSKAISYPTLEIDESVDYNPQYEWDVEQESEYIYDDEKENKAGLDSNNPDEEYERSFYNLIKVREYGHVDIEFPTYYLEDFEDYEMSYCGMESLDGIVYCKHVKILDISNNDLHDIDDLSSLKHLEELYAANNQIGYIDGLSNLSKLRILDISGNQVDDITPLFELNKLEYINLLGNSIPHSQLNVLKSKGILVVYN